MTSRPRLSLSLFALVLVGAAMLFAIDATKAPADFNDNTTCWGSTAKGEPDPDDPESPALRYTIQCDGPISGYSINTAPERQVVGAETEIAPLDMNNQVVPTDSFSCNGEFPGYGVNCVASGGTEYKTPGNYIIGNFYVDKDICAEPRLDPVVTVAYATVNSKGQAVQALAGPFDLGQPVDCPKWVKDKKHPKRKHRGPKIPKEDDTVLTGQEDGRRK